MRRMLIVLGMAGSLLGVAPSMVKASDNRPTVYQTISWGHHPYHHHQRAPYATYFYGPAPRIAVPVPAYAVPAYDCCEPRDSFYFRGRHFGFSVQF